MKFIEFLDDLSNDKIEPSFIRNLVTMPDEEESLYYSYGDRWCSVKDLLSKNLAAKDLLDKFAFYRLDPEYSFSSGNLKAQYIPDEDFINDGSAIVIFSIVGSQWLHTVRISNQNKMFAELIKN